MTKHMGKIDGHIEGDAGSSQMRITVIIDAAGNR